MTIICHIINQIGLSSIHNYIKLFWPGRQQKKIILLMMLIFLLAGQLCVVYSKETPKVAISPFTIHVFTKPVI